MSDHVKMYDENLVKEIMISTALCVHEMLKDDPQACEDDIYDFIETNFRQIINETLLAERESQDGAAEEPPFLP